MLDLSVNYIAIILAAVASMVVGFLWYSPLLFAKPWMKYSKLDAKKLKAAQGKMGKTYGLSFVAALITAFVLSQLSSYMLLTTLAEGATLGVWAWLGFVATTMFTGVLFQEMPWGLFLINSGYQLVSIVAMSIIVTIMI